MSREDDVGAAGVGEAAKDSRDELEDILKALEAGDSDKHGPNMKIIIGVIAGIVLVSVVLIIMMVIAPLLDNQGLNLTVPEIVKQENLKASYLQFSA